MCYYYKIVKIEKKNINEIRNIYNVHKDYRCACLEKKNI